MNTRLSLLALCLLMPGPLHAQADPQDCPRLRASGASADLYCMPLIAAPGINAHGSVELGWVPGPFTVAVSPSGIQRWNLLVATAGLTQPPRRGKGGLVVWAAPPSFFPLLKLGVLQSGNLQAPPVAFDRFLVLISEEADTSTPKCAAKSCCAGNLPATASGRPTPTSIFSARSRRGARAAT